MIADVVVVGGGFWGTAIALSCSAAGRETVVVDAAHRYAASPAAAGIVQWDWYRGAVTSNRTPSWWTPEHLRAGRDLLDTAGLRQTGEMFSTTRNRTWRARPDLWLIDSPQAVLDLHPRVGDRIARVEGRTAFGENDAYEAREAVVIAAGAQTDEILRGSLLDPLGVVKLRGRGFLVAGVNLDVPRTFMGVPYRHLTFRPTAQPGIVRVGDTVEQTPNARPRWTSYVEETISSIYPGAQIVSTMEGDRPVLPEFVVDWVGPGVIAATGGHRVGLGLAGGVGRRVTELLRAAA